MKRTVIAGVLMVCAAFPLFAPTHEVHDEDLARLVLGRPFTGSPEEETIISVLQKAAYLTIDQYSGSGLSLLNDLSAFGVKNLPQLAEIDFYPGQRNHEYYTHQGWDYLTYPSNMMGYNVQEKWEKRKMILVSTVDTIFKFQKNEQIKIDSFAALIYYTHIIRDHQGNSPKSMYDTNNNRIRIPLFTKFNYRFNRSGENSLNPTICTELLYHIPRLFREQQTDVAYQMLLRSLERYKLKTLPAQPTFSDEEAAEFQAAANEMLETLFFWIPQLLSREPFYQRAFQNN